MAFYWDADQKLMAVADATSSIGALLKTRANEPAGELSAWISKVVATCRRSEHPAIAQIGNEAEIRLAAGEPTVESFRELAVDLDSHLKPYISTYQTLLSGD